MSARTALCVLTGVSALALAACGSDGTTTGTTSSGTGGASTSSTTTTASSSSSSGAGGQKPVGPGAGEACDALKQDCVDPAAPKCALDLADPVLIPSTCAPSYGNDQLGDPCTRPTNKSGTDSCAGGLYCSPAGQPIANPVKRTCQTLCDADSDCPAPQFCSRFNVPDPMTGLPPDTRLIGICLAPCMFFDAATCSTGTKCLNTNSIDASLKPSCFGHGGKAVGDACMTNIDCGPVLGCDGVTHFCRTFCDDTHPCATHLSCQNPGNGTVPPPGTIGLCQGPPVKWTCDPNLWADGATCDCACGAPDPDCTNAALTVAGCTGTDVCKQGACVPPAWTCNGTFYNHLDGCDCNCGAVDPDCAVSGQMVIGCSMGQSCVAGACQ